MPKKIYENVLEASCNSPMIKLNKTLKEENVLCEIVAKCEFLLPGGSTKDRIAKKMVEDALYLRKVGKGGTIIEATAGNTGIGLALAGIVHDLNVIVTLPEKMSKEKTDILHGLGAKIIRAPTELSHDDENSYIGVAKRLNKEIPNSLLTKQVNRMIMQMCNPSNPMAHYENTAEEIWEQCEGKIDFVVICAATGGTLSGIGRKLKEKNKNIRVNLV